MSTMLLRNSPKLVSNWSMRTMDCSTQTISSFVSSCPSSVFARLRKSRSDSSTSPRSFRSRNVCFASLMYSWTSLMPCELLASAALRRPSLQLLVSMSISWCFSSPRDLKASAAALYRSRNSSTRSCRPGSTRRRAISASDLSSSSNSVSNTSMLAARNSSSAASRAASRSPARASMPSCSTSSSRSSWHSSLARCTSLGSTIS
mmetsp:Transcript_125510/g.304857  ORF Transcript_125510/g.304857 Transcript_125510/m.304857 type:complete len:204 (-) Transcript_125510:622-1233(-)